MGFGVLGTSQLSSVGQALREAWPARGGEPHRRHFVAAHAFVGKRERTLDGTRTVNGIRLHYVDWGGQGEVVLFLGPLFGGAHVFDSLGRHFTDRFHVLGLTRRGTEPSATPPSGYDTGTLAEDIRAFLDALNIGRATGGIEIDHRAVR